jgi:hypothetical protein
LVHRTHHTHHHQQQERQRQYTLQAQLPVQRRSQ